MSSLSEIARTAALVMLITDSALAQRTAITIEKPAISGMTIVPVAAPANLSVTPAGTQATVRWDAVSGATGYMVSRTSAMYGTVQQTAAPITSTTFTDISQQFDSRYTFTYKVMAVAADGRYAASEVTYWPAPATVSFPRWGGNCGGGSMWYTTTWSPVPEASGYIIRYLIHKVYEDRYGAVVTGENVDTLVTVPASTTRHQVQTNGPCHFGNITGNMIPYSVDAATVTAVFPSGAKSAETVCQGSESCTPPPWRYARLTH